MTGERRPQGHRSDGRSSGEHSPAECRRRTAVSAVGTLVVLAVLALAVAAVAPAATADSHANGSDPYVIEQGDQCIDVDPIVNESQSVEDFYDYRHPDSTPSATTYSSYGTTAYQADNTSILMLYRGSQGTSLVIVHEAFHESPSSGTNGSSVTFNVTGLSPEDDGWVVEDDDYDAQDDEFNHSATYSEMDWLWGQSRTDGGAYRGLDGDVEIGIDPAFNEAADVRYGGHYGGYVHDWQAITATGDGFERVSLDSLTENVTIRDGYCAAPPNASLATNATPEAGTTNVTLDAGGSQSPTGIVEYRWDLGGNDNAERVTTDPAIDHVFEAPGERNVTVTVVAGDGQTDAASVAVDVTDETPPTARIDAPAGAGVGQEVALSANASTDNHRIASYAWTLGDGTNATGETVTHAYESPGTYNVSTTVTDPSGNAATANATIDVSVAGPNASLVAPGQATIDESVLLDASGSDAGANATYEWVVDGSTNATNSSTYETTFDETGARDVSVVVTDAGGTDSAEATIDVYRSLNASVVATQTNVTAGEPVQFDASDSTGNVTRYEWAFDDGSTIADGNATVAHSYATAGEYAATLTVVGATGGTDTETIAIDVAPAPGPTAQLTAPGEVAVNETVTLDANGSEAGVNATYEWIVDGTVVNATNASTYETAFATTGDHGVGVRVTDANGSDAANATVTVVDESDDGDGGGGSDDGGSGDGGGSGGDGGDYGGGGDYEDPSQPDEPDQPLQTSVTVEGETIVVTAEHVEDGESFTVDVPANATVGAGAIEDGAGSTEDGTGSSSDGTGTNATGADVVALRALEITPAADAETLTVRFEPVARDVPGRFVTSSAIVPNATEEVAAIGYEVAVDREVMSAAGVSADDLTAFSNDDGWRSLETTSVAAGERIVANATADGALALGIGAVGPVLFVEDVETTGPVTNGTVGLAATVRNTGTERVDATLPIVLGGDRVAEPPVAVAAGEETVVETTVPVGASDAVAVDVGGLRRGLTVVAVTDLSVSPTEPGPNETVTVEATVTNRGSDAGAFDAELVFEGRIAATESVTLGPGDGTTVSFEERMSGPGTYEFGVGNATATIGVSERASFTDGNDDQTESAMAGFGALAALLVLAGLVAVAALARRR